jgi:hypothetical protein
MAAADTPAAELLGEAPDLGEDVPGGGAGRVHALRLGGAGGERGRVLGGARELHADGVVGELANDAGAGEDPGERACELLGGAGGHERGALVDHLLRVRGAADARDALGAEARGQDARRRQAGRGHEALGDRHDRGAPADARRPQPVDHLRQAARGHSQEHVVGAREHGRRGLDAQARGQLDAGKVPAVLAVALDRRGLLRGVGLQRRSQPSAGQQHGQRGAERAGSDDGRAPGARHRPRARPRGASWRTRTGLGLVHARARA